MRNQIKQIIKETVERIQEEEGEEEEEDDEEEGENKNEGKTLIKEENEEEEEENEGEEEEEDEKDSKNEDNKSSSNKSSDNIIILKDDNKDRDRGINLLNNNYRKINNFNYNNNKQNENENLNNGGEQNKEENNNDNNIKKGSEQNLGLGFVVVKPKKSINKDESNDNCILNLNTTESKQNESSVSTNNPNKKLNQFIQQIEHLKKIDDIKETIINAIHNNNKYIMDLFEKFQKNKFCLNPKALNAVYKQIQENPEDNDNKVNNEIKALIKEVPNLTNNIQDFLYDEYVKKNSELETFYTIYEQDKDKSDFFESIEMFLNKPVNKNKFENFNLNRIKKEIEPKINEKNSNLAEKSKEICEIMKKYNLFNEKEFELMKNSLENDDNMFNAAFQALIDDKDFDSFYETISLIFKNKTKKK